MCRRVLGVLGLLLVAAAPAAESAMAGESALIAPQSIKGTGEYSNSPSLIIDGQTPAEETAWNDDACVYWEKPQARFVITLDGVYQITGLAIQADNNDDYVIETSTDGKSFSPLLVVLGDWGGVFSGMQSLSTLPGDPHFVPEMAFKPASAKYVRLSARNGDEAYSVSELTLYGNKVLSDSVSPPVVTGKDATTAQVQTVLLKAKSVKGTGEFSHAAKLLIDQKMPKQETEYDNKSCVYWSDPETAFVVDLGEAFWISGLTIQVDNNDDYVIQVSLDGKVFKPLLTVRGEWGEVVDGMETLSTLAKDPQYLPQMAVKPAQARYVKLSAKGGDEAYSASELLLYGSKTAPVATASASQPTGGAVPPSENVPAVTAGADGDLESVFNAIDTNKDGRVSKEEYAAIWKDKLDVDKNFAFFDKDASGFIEKAEFLSLRDGLKEGAGQDQSGQNAEGEEQSSHLDPILVQKAIDALPKWAQINELAGAGKYAELDAIVKSLGFENWLVLNFYFNMVWTVSQAAENPGIKDMFTPALGQEAVEVILRPENLAKIKANAPTSSSR